MFGKYVYFGTYDTDGDGKAEPVKYRVLDSNTTVFGGTTMLLDCDSVLWAASNTNYGYSNTDVSVTNREKIGVKPYWWLRSYSKQSSKFVGIVIDVPKTGDNSAVVLWFKILKKCDIIKDKEGRCIKC